MMGRSPRTCPRAMRSLLIRNGGVMRRLRVGILDLVTNGPATALYARLMNANLASIMPQALGVWCEAAGHEAQLVCYTGFEDLADALPAQMDLLFITAFSEMAQPAYAISHRFRQLGTVTAIGGPHARCYPEDARRYFDYVFGFTNETIVRDVLAECAPHRPLGVQVGAAQQVASLPGVK